MVTYVLNSYDVIRVYTTLFVTYSLHVLFVRRFKTTGASKGNAATLYSQSMAKSLESVVTLENPVLSQMADWSSGVLSPTGSADLLEVEVFPVDSIMLL